MGVPEEMEKLQRQYRELEARRLEILEARRLESQKLEDEPYEKEITTKGLDTYEALASEFKNLQKDLAVDMARSDARGELEQKIDGLYDKADLKAYEAFDTVEELKAEVKDLMKQRDLNNERFQELETRYAKELEGIDPSQNDYEALAREYKALYAVLSPGDSVDDQRFLRADLKSFEHLRTYDDLKIAYTALLEERDSYVERTERYDPELEDFDTYEKLAEHYKDLHKELTKDLPIDALERGMYEGKDLKDFKHLNTYEELKDETRRLMEQHDNRGSSNVPIKDVEKVEEGTGDPIEIEMPPDHFGQENVEQPPWAQAYIDDYIDKHGEDSFIKGFKSSFGQEKEAPPVDKPEKKVEDDTGDPVEGEASRLIGRGGALPTDGLRDEAFFSGEDDREDAPDAAAARADTAATDDAVGGSAVGAGAVGEALGPSETTEDAAGEAILVDPTAPAEDEPFVILEPGADETSNVFVGEWDKDAMARNWDIIGSPSEPVEPLGEPIEDASEALGAPGDTIEDAAGDATGEAILIDPPGAAGDVVEDMDEPAEYAVLGDGVEPPPFMEDTLEGGVGLGGEDVGNEDVVKHMDDPVF